MKLLLSLIAPAAIVSALEQEKSFKHLKGRALVADDASSMSMAMAGIVAQAFHAPVDASSSAHVYGSKSSKGDVYGSKSGKCDEVDKSPSLKNVQDAVCNLKKDVFDSEDETFDDDGCGEFIVKVLDFVVAYENDDNTDPPYDSPVGPEQYCRHLEQCWWLLGKDSYFLGGGLGGGGLGVLGHNVAQPVCGWAEDYLGCDRALKISQLREVCLGIFILWEGGRV